MVQLHDFKAERFEMLGGDCGVGQHLFLRHTHAMGIPGTPQAGRPRPHRLRAKFRHRIAISFQRLKRIGAAQQIKAVQFDGFARSEHATEKSRVGRQTNTSLIQSEIGRHIGAGFVART